MKRARARYNRMSLTQLYEVRYVNFAASRNVKQYVPKVSDFDLCRRGPRACDAGRVQLSPVILPLENSFDTVRY